MAGLAELIEGTRAGPAPRIVIVVGAGGVGKTTTAATLAAMAAATRPGRVLVLTVDPARRLATALGLAELGDTEREIPAFAPGQQGRLWAAMLDTKQGWDALVRRHAPDAKTAARILANPLYHNVAGRFVASHDYIAMERLYELATAGGYDLIVVDTPPSSSALDFIEAPARMAEFFSSRLLRLLIAPYRSRVTSVASRPFTQIADRLLGSQFLGDIAEFFALFQTMYPGFVRRAGAVEALLAAPATSFVVVTTLEPAPHAEAQRFLALLAAKRLHVGALVLNKVLPGYLLDPATDARARMLLERLGNTSGLGKGARVTTGLQPPTAQEQRVLEEVARNFLNLAVVARQQEEARAAFAHPPPVVATAGELDDDIGDLPGLLRLGSQIW